jgi:23S rRNA pseudouridine1911/1915/1917 synthase
MLNNGYIYTDRILREHAGMTVYEYYSTRHPHFTSAEWRTRIETGFVTRGGIALAPDDTLSGHEVLHYFRAPWSEPEVPTDISILHSDEHVIVFDKPDCMPVLPGGTYLENSMVMLVRRTHDMALSPLHRLGRGTTGAILFTRSNAAAVAFSRMMRMREIGKIYLALVHDADMPDEFTIDTPIGRVPYARLGDIHDVSPHGKVAVSKCTVLARNADNDTALVRVSILTGRTHQIRIHLASEGHPLVGDRFYQGRNRGSDDIDNRSNTVLPGDPGYILHSWKLLYRDPFSGRDVEVVAPVRSEILEWCERAGYALEGVRGADRGFA